MTTELAIRDQLRTVEIESGSLRVTATGLAKSILDANEIFREFLRESKIHDFDTQPKGSDHKRIVTVDAVQRDGTTVACVASLYRSRTRGDARLWVQGAERVVAPGEVLMMALAGPKLLVFNGSDLQHFNDKVWPYLRPSTPTASIFEGLLGDLRRLSRRGFILAPVAGPGSVGRLLEDELGIPMNSSKNPDYHGIEIKSSRGINSRPTLFAQVPDWKRSRLKSSAEILQAHGYETPEGRKLSCTLSVKAPNSQSLFLHVERDTDTLHARFDEFDPEDVVCWQLDKIRSRFVHKHSETVWVEAMTEVDGGNEMVRFVALEHTTGPKPEMLVPLLRRGRISVDFLLREDGDKGYLFKVSQPHRDELFEGSRRFILS